MADTPYIDDTEIEDGNIEETEEPITPVEPDNEDEDITTPVDPEEDNGDIDNSDDNTEEKEETNDPNDISGEEGPTLPLDPTETVDPPEAEPNPIPTTPVTPPPPVEEGGLDLYYATWRATAPEIGEGGVIEKVPYDPLPNVIDTLTGELEDGADVHPEDYFFTNQSKELVQVRFGQMLRAIEIYCPMEIDRYPGANTLRNLIISIAEDLHTLKSSDIGYDGELSKQYGTVKAIITYILDTVTNISASGVRGDGITVDPTGDTPQYVIDELEGANRLVDIINYIYNNYRYAGVSVPALEVALDGGAYNALDFNLSKLIDQNGKISVQNMTNRIYTYITQTLDHSVTLRVTNSLSYILPVTEDPITVANLNIMTQVDTPIEYDIQIYIKCNMPGTLQVALSEDGKEVLPDLLMLDALTTGYHVLRYSMYQNEIPANTENPIYLVLKFYIDTDVVGESDPAVIDIGKVVFKATGQHLTTFEPDDEEEEGA